MDLAKKLTKNEPGTDYIDSNRNFLNSKLVIDNEAEINASTEIIMKLQEF